MLTFPTHTASCPRLAAQDRHAPKSAVRLALSNFCARRGWAGPIPIHGHLTVRARKASI